MITLEYKDKNILIRRIIDNSEDSQIEPVIREITYFLKGLAFTDVTINRYINDPDLVRYTRKKKK